eukprot:SAG11_NODE_707_length_7651_cov_4.133872_4_plen_607_part_00
MLIDVVLLMLLVLPACAIWQRTQRRSNPNSPSAMAANVGAGPDTPPSRAELEDGDHAALSEPLISAAQKISDTGPGVSVSMNRPSHVGSPEAARTSPTKPSTPPRLAPSAPPAAQTISGSKCLGIVVSAWRLLALLLLLALVGGSVYYTFGPNGGEARLRPQTTTKDMVPRGGAVWQWAERYETNFAPSIASPLDFPIVGTAEDIMDPENGPALMNAVEKIKTSPYVNGSSVRDWYRAFRAYCWGTIVRGQRSHTSVCSDVYAPAFIPAVPVATAVLPPDDGRCAGHARLRISKPSFMATLPQQVYSCQSAIRCECSSWYASRLVLPGCRLHCRCWRCAKIALAPCFRRTHKTTTRYFCGRRRTSRSKDQPMHSSSSPPSSAPPRWLGPPRPISCSASCHMLRTSWHSTRSAVTKTRSVAQTAQGFGWRATRPPSHSLSCGSRHTSICCVCVRCASRLEASSSSSSSSSTAARQHGSNSCPNCYYSSNDVSLSRSSCVRTDDPGTGDRGGNTRTLRAWPLGVVAACAVPGSWLRFHADGSRHSFWRRHQHGDGKPSRFHTSQVESRARCVIISSINHSSQGSYLNGAHNQSPYTYTHTCIHTYIHA